MPISKSEHTRNTIIDGYLDLITQKEWDKITVMEICDQISISRGTFYRYFSDIYELMEELQRSLLEDLEKRYRRVPYEPSSPRNTDELNIKRVPPLMLTEWFAFCSDNKKQISILLHPQNGDPYFKQRLKNVLQKHINLMMDTDGCPNDKFRSHFVKLFLELHFLCTQTWLDAKEEDFLSIDEIVDVLNTMRIGANYLSQTQES